MQAFFYSQQEKQNISESFHRTRTWFACNLFWLWKANQVTSMPMRCNRPRDWEKGEVLIDFWVFIHFEKAEISFERMCFGADFLNNCRCCSKCQETENLRSWLITASGNLSQEIYLSIISCRGYFWENFSLFLLFEQSHGSRKMHKLMQL